MLPHCCRFLDAAPELRLICIRGLKTPTSKHPQGHNGVRSERLGPDMFELRQLKRKDPPR